MIPDLLDFSLCKIHLFSAFVQLKILNNKSEIKAKAYSTYHPRLHFTGLRIGLFLFIRLRCLNRCLLSNIMYQARLARALGNLT